MADDHAELADGAEAMSHNSARSRRGYDAAGPVLPWINRRRLNCELLGTIALVALESAQIETQSRRFNARKHHPRSAIRGRPNPTSIGC